MLSDVAYLTIRADEERVAAMNAAHPNARQKHLELALRFQELADGLVEAECALLVDDTRGRSPER
ncbi:MAG: hypothetical protein NVS9B15_25950 [Acidobacteriaceae bacterium]